MPTQGHLKLAKPDTSSDTIPFERRGTIRRSISGRVTALCTVKENGETINKICSLQLEDLSDCGLGALSQDVVPAGASITIFFPPHGAERGFDLYGTVVRCSQLDDRFDVGIRLQSKTAAA